LTTISQALQQSVETLQNISETPNLDSQILLAHILNKPRAWVVTHPDHVLPQQLSIMVQDGLNLLSRGTPLPYIIGKWEFFGLEFHLNRDTLIPRPETELLVERALEWLDEHPGQRFAADIGTGSGCIAVALAKNSPEISFLAGDISHPALLIAKKNIFMHDVQERIELIASDLIPPVDLQFDMICANLPYIPSQTLAGLKIQGHEPDLALDGGGVGLDHISRLISYSPPYVKPGAVILIEIESSQGEQVSSLASSTFQEADITLHKDLAGRDRLVQIQL
jgi:release factor glutamine methyltransferase